MSSISHVRAALAVSLFVACLTTTVAAQPAAATARRYVVIPPNKDSAPKLHRADGRVVWGPEVLRGMQRDAQHVLWLGGISSSRWTTGCARSRSRTPALRSD